MQQALIVALMQADRRLIQYVGDALQAGADLRRQPDALRLAAGQGVGGAVQSQVLQADVDQEAQAHGDFAQYLTSDDHLVAAEGLATQRSDPAGSVGRGQSGDVGNRVFVDGDGQTLRAKAAAAAGRAGLHGQVRINLRGVRAAVGSHHERHNAVEALFPAAGSARAPIATLPVPVDLKFAAARALEDELLLVFRQVLPGRVEAEAGGCGQLLPLLRPQPAVAYDAGIVGNGQAALAQRLARVRHEQGQVDLGLFAETFAGGTATLRCVEGKAAWLQFRHGKAAGEAAQEAAEEHFLAVQFDADQPLAQLQGRFHCFGQPAQALAVDMETVHDRRDRVLALAIQFHRLV